MWQRQYLIILAQAALLLFMSNIRDISNQHTRVKSSILIIINAKESFDLFRSELSFFINNNKHFIIIKFNLKCSKYNYNYIIIKI
jgi:hypothetical protein